MERSFRRLSRGPFDLLVVGGGVYGAWTAYDAALRGLNVALIEKTDWAAATSSASSKLIHGGLRYLEHADFGLVRKSLLERRRLSRLAPHRVHPLRFVLPVYEDDRVGRLRLRIGLWIYDRLAGKGQPVAAHGVLRRRELLDRYELRAEGLSGGLTYGDCQTDDARFALEIVDGAMRAGVAAVNRARATEIVVEKGRVVGARVEDSETGETIELHAAVTIDCTGPWCSRLLDRSGALPRTAVRLTKGIHLVLPPLPVDEAFLLSSNDDRRIVFVIPWYGRTLVGTTDTDYEGDPDAVRVEPEDVSYLLERANRVLGGKPWTRANVIGSFAGLRTLPADGGRSPSSLTREWSLIEPLDGLLASVGGKYTSARADAGLAVDRTFERLGRDPGSCATADRPFPWCPAGDYDDWSRDVLRRGLRLGMDEENIENCRLRFGARVERLFERIREAPELAVRVVPQAPFCLAEIVHAVTEEMALTLEDVLRRRVPLLLLCRLTETEVRGVADLVGNLLGWSAERRRGEVRSVLERSDAPVPAHEPA